MPANGDCSLEVLDFLETCEQEQKRETGLTGLRVDPSRARRVRALKKLERGWELKEDSRIKDEGDTGQDIVDKMLLWLDKFSHYSRMYAPPGAWHPPLLDVAQRGGKKPFYVIYNTRKPGNVFFLQAHDGDLSDYGLLFTSMRAKGFAKKWQKRNDMIDGTALGWTTSISSRSNSRSYRKKKDLRDGTFGDFEKELGKLL